MILLLVATAALGAMALIGLFGGDTSPGYYPDHCSGGKHIIKMYHSLYSKWPILTEKCQCGEFLGSEIIAQRNSKKEMRTKLRIQKIS